MSFWALSDICLLVAGVILVVFSQIYHMPNLMINFTLSNDMLLSTFPHIPASLLSYPLQVVWSPEYSSSSRSRFPSVQLSRRTMSLAASLSLTGCSSWMPSSSSSSALSSGSSHFNKGPTSSRSSRLHRPQSVLRSRTRCVIRVVKASSGSQNAPSPSSLAVAGSRPTTPSSLAVSAPTSRSPTRLLTRTTPLPAAALGLSPRSPTTRSTTCSRKFSASSWQPTCRADHYLFLIGP